MEIGHELARVLVLVALLTYGAVVVWLVSR